MKSAALALAASLVLAAPVGVEAADFHANPSNLSSTFGAAPGGSTIYLASGSYSFSGGTKSPTVTLLPEPGAAVTMNANFRSASGIRLDNLGINNLNISGSSHDLSVANSRFSGMTVIQSQSMANANILLDHNTFSDIDTCDGCYEGRVSLPGAGSNPSGVTIANSLFEGGNTDGIQNGANGVRIINNEFRNIKQAGGVHTDAIQLYGQRNTTISGNYIHDNSSAIMAPDGGTNEMVTNNVIVGDGGPQVQFGSHSGTQFTHNTVKNADVHMDSKDGEDPSRNGVLRDNVMVASSFGTTGGSGCSGCTVSYNLFSVRSDSGGTSALVATPVFAAGGSPTTYAGFLLASGSPGKGSASDGTDRGIVPGAAPPNPGAGAGTPQRPPGDPIPATPGSDPGSGTSDAAARTAAGGGATGTAARVFAPASWRYKPRTARVGTRVVLDATVTKVKKRRCVWRYKHVRKKGCRVGMRFTTKGTKKVSLTVTDTNGAKAVSVKKIRVLKRGHHRSRHHHR